MFKTRWLGSTGEQLAVRFLEESGFRIVATNFSAPIGRGLRGGIVTGEIDIVAYDVETPPFPLSFVEVKTRTAEQIKAPPEAAVDLRKQRQMIRTARVYRAVMNVEDFPYRFDVVSVLMREDEPEVRLYRGFFTERKRYHS
jgi:putative endonuclease